MKYKNYFLSLAYLLLSHFNFAQNPVIKDIGMSDPHVRVFNDTLFLYSGHDYSPNDKTWIMKDWRVFSSTNLINWTIRTSISPKDNYMDDNSTDCWASDAASRNGKYYFYFSDRKRGIGVMTSDAPYGTFKDPLGKALVAPMHDPTILIDDNENQTPYLVYGDKDNGNGFHIAKLNDDMISLAEKPKLIEINGEEWEKAPHWMDKNYIFKYNDTYYLSWGRDYAISNNIYGPYKCVGAVGHGHNLNEFAHGSFFNWKGQFYHIWCYYIEKGFKYRESIISYCHMDDDGKIVTDIKFLDAHYANGVGQYNASWDTIEAEWYYEISGDIKKQGNRKDGFVITNIQNDDWVRFANITFDKSYEKCVSNLLLNGKKGLLEIRSGSPSGTVLSELKLSSSKSFQEFKNVIEVSKGKKDIYMIFKGDKGSSLQIDWIRFE
ncbi:family 43 glycosylhydrolase [Flavivirga aquimarina]|uniref:Family 43 glycosylhydrolase n=1 Tax=Flavivirga aquimarina TaxID=2027862 RepID=A0ABT8WE61_9FLAO|nr:family 43 glycosylhydrolase [Flavivirga aquimarina]MDO5971319.1 family 43 glycosylhydrolase [Flavivirga aquimarina]